MLHPALGLAGPLPSAHHERYYFLGRHLWGNRIEVYHAVNLACFAANGLLLLWLCLDWMSAPWASLAAALYVSRLAHHQLLAHSVEFQSLASVSCMLLASKLFLAGRRRGQRSLEVLALPVCRGPAEQGNGRGLAGDRRLASGRRLPFSWR